jgi:hypothetical protein
MSSTRMLSSVSPGNVSLEIKDPVDPTALGQAKDIIAELRPSPNGAVDAAKLLEVANRLGDIPPDRAGSFTVSAEDCKKAFDGLAEADRSALVNIHQRVKTFAEAQRKSVVDIEIDIPGGKAGHTVSPCRGKYHKWAAGTSLTTFVRAAAQDAHTCVLFFAPPNTQCY